MDRVAQLLHGNIRITVYYRTYKTSEPVVTGVELEGKTLNPGPILEAILSEWREGRLASAHTAARTRWLA